MVSKKKWLIGRIGLLVLFSGFSLASVQASPNSMAALERKIKILDKVQIQPSYTQVLIGKLESDWPKLFTAKSADDLFNKYSFMTWYIDDEARQRLKAQINDHPYYLEYEKLLKSGLLPAKKVTTTDIHFDSYSGPIIAVTATYDVVLHDGTARTFEATLKARKESFSYFSPILNTEDGQPMPANSKEEELNLEYKFKLLNSIDTIRKLSRDQLYFLFDLKPEQ